MFPRQNERRNLIALKSKAVAILTLFSAAILIAPAYATPVAFQPFPNNSTHSSAAVAQAIANVPTNAGVVYPS
jgi:hypothetical protein